MDKRSGKVEGVVGVVALAVCASACSSVALPEATGGSGAGSAGTGGAAVVVTGAGGQFFDQCLRPNPDSAPGGACTPECQSVTCPRPCTQDCCGTCGIDQMGTRYCTCPNPGGPFDNCSCPKSPTIPDALHGGPCVPAGDSRPAALLSNSLVGVPCKALNLVCFTTDSQPAAERGCICMSDGVLHCGPVSHWFTNDGVPVDYRP